MLHLGRTTRKTGTMAVLKNFFPMQKRIRYNRQGIKQMINRTKECALSVFKVYFGCFLSVFKEY
jgi:hypothetical protein